MNPDTLLALAVWLLAIVDFVLGVLTWPPWIGVDRG